MSRAWWCRYAVALLAVGAALPVVVWLTRPGLGAAQVFLAAVMVSAWYGGLGPGLLATLLAALALEFALPPAYSPDGGQASALRAGVFLLVALLISSLNAAKRRLEQALRAEYRRKDEFLDVLAHELRGPLGALLNAAQLLRLRPSDPAAVTQSGEMIQRQARHLGRLIDDLLDVARIRQGKLELHREPVELAVLVRDAVEASRFLMAEKGQELDVSLPADSVLLDADPTRMEQVLANLLTNAAKFTERGGHVEVIGERTNGEVLLRVRDDGPGIPPDLLPHVFDLHVQGKSGAHGGLGIGLSLVRSLVQMHGGSVAAFSEGRGSEFVIRLPALASELPRVDVVGGATGRMLPATGPGD